VCAAPATPRWRPIRFGDGADGGVLAFVARDEQHALLVADLHVDGDVHVREDDDVVQWDE
jgi:hypothetical protein